MNKDARIAELEDRVAELEDILGASPSMSQGYRALGLSKKPCEILGVLMRRSAVSREQMYAVIYGTLPDDEQPLIKILDVHISHIRKALRPHDIEVTTNYSEGWTIAPEDKQKLKAWLAQFLVRCGSDPLALERVMSVRRKPRF